MEVDEVGDGAEVQVLVEVLEGGLVGLAVSRRRGFFTCDRGVGLVDKVQVI